MFHWNRSYFRGSRIYPNRFFILTGGRESDEKGILVLLLAGVMSRPSLQVASSQRQVNDVVQRRVEALLARMTLEEKLGQLQQLDGGIGGGYRREHLDLVRKGLVGSFLNVRGARNVKDSKGSRCNREKSGA